MRYDVAVIGAGVTGCLIARALSMKDAAVCVIEAEADVAAGASKANSGIVHAGYDAAPGSLKARFNVAGAAMMPQLAAALSVPYENNGSFVVAFGAEDENQLENLRRRGEENGVATRMITGGQARSMEPALSADITAALFAPAAGIICPYTLTIAAAENAAGNGVTFFFHSRVTAVTRTANGFVIEAEESLLKRAASSTRRGCTRARFPQWRVAKRSPSARAKANMWCLTRAWRPARSIPYSARLPRKVRVCCLRPRRTAT